MSDKLHTTPDVKQATLQFGSAAAQEATRLRTQGISGQQVVTQLQGRVLEPSNAQPILSESQNRDVKLVMASTGFSRDEAIQTVLLKAEITKLRRQGMESTAVIDSLASRLKKVVGVRKGRDSEDGQDEAIAEGKKKLKFAVGNQFASRSSAASQLVTSSNGAASSSSCDSSNDSEHMRNPVCNISAASSTASSTASSSTAAVPSSSLAGPSSSGNAAQGLLSNSGNKRYQESVDGNEALQQQDEDARKKQKWTISNLRTSYTTVRSAS